MSEHNVSGVEGGARVATRRTDASDTTPDTVHAQLQSDIDGALGRMDRRGGRRSGAGDFAPADSCSRPCPRRDCKGSSGMTVRNLGYLLQPRSIALIGASPRPGSVGLITACNLAKGGSKSPIWLVNPKHATIDGHPCFASIAALPETPDRACPWR
jgi:CoA binding domain